MPTTPTMPAPAPAPLDTFRADCQCSIWLAPVELAGCVCRRCGYSICFDHHGGHIAPGTVCQLCTALGLASKQAPPPPIESAGAALGLTPTGTATATLPTAPAPQLHTRWRPRNTTARRTEFAPVLDNVGRQLELLGPDVERLFMVGPRAGGGSLSGLVSWAGGDLPRGWTHAAAGHYLDSDSPVMRYARPSGAVVELHRAEAWFGDAPMTTADAGTAWRLLGEMVGRRLDGRVLLATPSATGRYLFEQSLPYGHEWPVLSDELQELIRSTSGQGRIEMLPVDHAGGDVELFEYDGRFMYGALCWGLGAGVPVRDHGTEYAGQQRGRYRVTVGVPKGWELPGIIGRQTDDGWEWPSEPGRTFTTWADGAEVGIALDHGWSVKVRERLLFPPYTTRGPLDTWAQLMADMRAEGTAIGGEVGRLLAAAVRSMTLHAIGAFQGRGHAVTRMSANPNDVPADAAASVKLVAGGTYMWSHAGGQAWAEMSHPEWSAAIWARARARLLSGPSGTKNVRVGMLHVPPRTVLSARTDALYMTVDPRWPDDGKAGRFVLKNTYRVPRMPRNSTELLMMKEVG